jgi:hypothetical protein
VIAVLLYYVMAVVETIVNCTGTGTETPLTTI